MKELLKKIIVANGDFPGTVGSFEELVVLLENIQVHMDFLVTDNPPFDMIIGSPMLKLLQACIDLKIKWLQ